MMTDMYFLISLLFLLKATKDFKMPALYVRVLYLYENKVLCHLYQRLIGFCNQEVKCLQRGTDWFFK
jgi:hypothetical protein